MDRLPAPAAVPACMVLQRLACGTRSVGLRQRTVEQSSASPAVTVAPRPCEPPHVAGNSIHPPMPEGRNEKARKDRY